MDMEEAMFGPEVKISNPKKEKPKKNINLTKWFALGLGGIFGLSHIGLIGMISRKDNLPIISPPVGPYTSYLAEVSKEGYRISYKANDPKTAFITKDIKEKGGFLGLANENKEIIEEYTMNGDVHIQKDYQVNGGGNNKIASNKSEACIKAIGSAEGTGRLVGTSIGASAAPSLSSLPYVGWVAAGWVAMFGGNQGADIGGKMAEDLNKDC